MRVCKKEEGKNTFYIEGTWQQGGRKALEKRNENTVKFSGQN